MPEYFVDPDIRKAKTLPPTVYTDRAVLTLMQERIFARSWHFVGDTDSLKAPGQVLPFTLCPGSLDEPLLLTRDADDALNCLSNVCTHRGNLVADHPGNERYLRCRYHGRRFGLDGTFQQMPEFEGVEGFPAACDSLPKVPFACWKKLIFSGLTPACPFEEQISPIRTRLDWLPIETFVFDPARSREYLVQANWALYVENYLDALHIPFVHYELANALSYDDYNTENFRMGNLQVAVSEGGEEVFEIPGESPDFGRPIAAYYAWLFPSTMLNFYPWGLSINTVHPLGVGQTKVSFLRYVWNSGRTGRHLSADAAVDRVEREDEAIVETVQKGVRSRLYTAGRYSPTRETGTHHFHRLLAEFLNSAPRT